MVNNITIIKFMFSKNYQIMDNALSFYKEYEIVDFSTSIDLSTYFTTLDSAILIASLEKREDLIEIATFMKDIKKIAKDKPIKVIVINFSGNKAFELAIGRIGIQDIVQADINAKAFKFKLDFWMRSFQAQLKTHSSKNDLKTKKAAADDKSPKLSNITWQAPLELEDDIWIIERDLDCKKILSKWLISITGPSPYAGDWKEVKNNYWEFELTQPHKELLVYGKGCWYFKGDAKPDFSWKDNKWRMTGEQVSLYYKEDAKIEYRFQSKDKVLFVCKNSLFAKTKEEIIRETCNKDLFLKSESQRLKEMSGEGSTDHLENDPLSGKSSTDKISNRNLSGSIGDHEAAQKEHDSQSYQASKESSHWEGKNSQETSKTNKGHSVQVEPFKNAKNLEMDRSDNEHEKYYRNHNPHKTDGTHPSKDHNQNGSSNNNSNAFNDMNTSEEAKDQNKGHSVQKDSLKNAKNLEMDRSDNEHQKYYKNQNSQNTDGTNQNRDHNQNASSHNNSNPFNDTNTSEDTKNKNNIFSDGNLDKTVRIDGDNNLENITSDSKVICFLKQNTTQLECILDDSFDENIIFISKEEGLLTNKMVHMNMTYKTLNKDTSLNLSGSIVSIEGDGEGNNYIIVQVTQEESKSFSTFLKMYDQRQSNITKFLKLSKGL